LECKAPFVGFRIKLPCGNKSNGAIEPWSQYPCQDFKYLWSTGSTNCSIGGLSAGMYYVTVTFQDTCKNVQSFNLESQYVPSLVANVTHICGDNTLNFGKIELIGDYNYAFSWSLSGRNGKVLDPVYIAGKYCVTGIPPTPGCLIDSCFYVKKSPSMEVSVEESYGQCDSTVPAIIIAKVTGGIKPYSYYWNNIKGDSIFAFPLSKNNTDSVSLKLIDSVGCIYTAKFKKPSPPGKNLVTYVSYPVCIGSKGAFIITEVKDLLAPYTYQWNNGQTGFIMTGALKDTAYKVTVTDARGCTVVVRDMFVWKENANSGTYDPIVKHSCFGLPNGFVDINKQDGDLRTFYWSNGTHKPKADSLYPGNYSLVMIENSNHDCVFVGNYTIKSIEGNFPAKVMSTCKDSNGVISIDQTLNKNNRLSVKWGDVNSTNFNRYKLATGTYYATITYYDCEFPSKYTVVDFSDSSNISNIKINPCKGFKNGYIKALDIYGVDPLKYTWVKSIADTLAFNSNQNAISDLSDGIYLLTITDSRGCTVSKSYTLFNGNLDTIDSGCQKKIFCDNYLIKTIPKSIKGFVMAYIWNSTQDEIKIKAISNEIDSFTVVVKKNGSNGWQQESTFKLNGTKYYKITKNGDYLVIVSDGQCEREFYFTVCTKEIKLCSTPKIIPCTGTGNDDGKIELISPIFCAYNSQTMKTDTLSGSDFTFFWVRLSDGYEFGVNENVISSLSAGDYKLKYRRYDCWSGLFEKTFTITCNCNINVNISELNNTCPYRSNGSVKLSNVSTNYKIMWSTGQLGGSELKNLAKGDYSVKILDESTGCSKIFRFTIEQNNVTPTLIKDCIWEYNCNNDKYKIDFGIENVEPLPESCNNIVTCKVFHNTYTETGGYFFTDIQVFGDKCIAKKVCINGNIVDNNFTVPRQKELDKERCGTIDICKFENNNYIIENSFIPGELHLKGNKDSCIFEQYCSVPNYTEFKTNNTFKGNTQWIIDPINNIICDYKEFCSYKNEPSYYTTKVSQILNDTCVSYWGGACYKLAYCNYSLLTPKQAITKIIDSLNTTDSLLCNWKYNYNYYDCSFKWSYPYLGIVERNKLDSILIIDNVVANIYPNPFNNEINIEFLTKLQNDVEISVLDVVGREIIKSKKVQLDDNQKIIFNLVDLPDGFYEIKIKNLVSHKINTYKLIHYNK
jgi:hypothetical protein